MIYLCSADDTAGRQCISAPPTSLFLSLMPPRKRQPFPPERRNCSHTFRGVLQFRLPSAPQRYNTLDFPTENRVPTGMLLAPIGNPEPRGYSPLDTPRFRRQCIYKSAPPCIFHNLRKQKIPQILSQKREENLRDFFVILSVPNGHTHNLQFKQLGTGIVVTNFCDNVDI